jgi:hypothetical protein
VLGVAVLGSVFSATGGLGSPAQFTAGLTAALTVSAAILAASALVILLAPEIRRPGRHAAGGASASAGVSVSGAGGRGGDIASFGGDLILILDLLIWASSSRC